MLQLVSVEPRALDDYVHQVGEPVIERLRRLARPLRGARLLHVSATAFGGGVSEILYSLVPLLQDAGLNAEWRIIYGADAFFNVTKGLHNALQGAPLRLTKEARRIYLETSHLNAQAFKGQYDFVVVHDPQPAAILSFLDRRLSRVWIWRSHIDTSHPNEAALSFLKPHLEQYDAAIFTMPQYIPSSIRFPHVFIVWPAIDPLSAKNEDMTMEKARRIIRQFGIDPDRPLITQVSRFDPWKDPLGVIDAYRMVKVEIPDIQLALVGSMATDDPQGWEYYERTVRRAGEDFNIHILHNFEGVGNIEVNAFQRASTVVVQKSIREGFGLVVAEAQWKGKAVIGGNVGGIPLQVIDGQTGFLVNDSLSAAQRIHYLLTHPRVRDQLGLRALERVRERFLTPRLLRDYLNLLNALNRASAAARPAAALAPRRRRHGAKEERR